MMNKNIRVFIFLLVCQIVISQVDHPTYIQIDLYKKFVNGTFNQQIPLDFVVYPISGNTLPLTAGANYGYVTMQLPLFWRNFGQSWDAENPEGSAVGCKYGPDSASTCSYFLYVFEIKTPISTTYE
jgi:hypothetical protein